MIMMASIVVKDGGKWVESLRALNCQNKPNSSVQIFSHFIEPISLGVNENGTSQYLRN